MAQTYTAKDITVLEGLDPVRKRPGMYIGGVGSPGLHHLVWEILDNAVDEAMNGHAGNIHVRLHADRSSITVADDGRGVPVDRHPKSGKSALEVIFTTLHAGGKFEHRTYRTAGGLHGVGASVVNALSAELVATSKRDGRLWEQRFRRGRPLALPRQLGSARGTGTTVFFRPDPQIFPKTEFDSAVIAERLEVVSYLHKGVRVVFDDEGRGEKRVFQHADGLQDYLAHIVAARRAATVHEQAFALGRDHDETGSRVNLVLQWTEATDEHVRSYVNGVPTGSGGTHETGLRAGVGKAVRNFIETHGLSPKGVTLAADDIREGLTGVLSIFVRDPQFQGQTKDRLNNPGVRAPLRGAVQVELERWLHQSRSAAERIVGRVLLASRAREAARSAAAAISRRPEKRGRAVLPGKLSDAALRDPASTEIFLVEGDSAGGSAKQARDRARQAILPLRGKVLNVAQAAPALVAKNREIADIVLALGCGAGAACDPDGLRYRRIILLADADADGHHITTLLLTAFVVLMLPVLRAGRVFVAEPPLYRIEVGGEVRWASDDAARDAILAGLPGSAKSVLTRFKGLGEMQPAALWETTLNPATRRLIQVRIPADMDPRAWVNALMGKDPSVRKELIAGGVADRATLDV